MSKGYDLIELEWRRKTSQAAPKGQYGRIPSKSVDIRETPVPGASLAEVSVPPAKVWDGFKSRLYEAEA